MTRFAAYLSLLLIATQPAVAERAIEPLKENYQKLGTTPFDAVRGQKIWEKESIHTKSGKQRSCSDCHSSNLSTPGRHIRTGKIIAPLSPSINPKRFTSIKKVEKWFKRNCKWTLGRLCTPQEKGDILTFIQTKTWSN